jgi:hypothetical protein
MIQQAQPGWLVNPKQMPEPLAALLLALSERDNSIQQAITRRNPYKIALNQGVRGATAQLQGQTRGRPFKPAAERVKPDNQQPSIPAEPI